MIYRITGTYYRLPNSMGNQKAQLSWDLNDTTDCDDTNTFDTQLGKNVTAIGKIDINGDNTLIYKYIPSNNWNAPAERT